MSKLIVEMEMPKRCIECGVRLKCKRYVCGLYQDIAEDLNPLMGDKDCLIVGILPDEHGDLIDRDILLQTFQNADYETYNDYCEAFDTVEAAETVIAAERKDDDKTRSNTPS